MDICMKPNFNEMSRKELRTYVLAHRDDDEAFYALADRISADAANKVPYPPLKSLEDIENYPEFLEKLRHNLGHQESA
jgi:hypothetical protein